MANATRTLCGDEKYEAGGRGREQGTGRRRGGERGRFREGRTRCGRVREDRKEEHKVEERRLACGVR